MTTLSSLPVTHSINHRALRQFFRNPAGLLGLLILIVVVAMAVIAPWLFPDDPLDMVATPLVPPGSDWTWPSGTDAMGRDPTAGLLHGARISLLIGLGATLIGLCAGTLLDRSCVV